METMNIPRLFGVLALLAPGLGGCAARATSPAAPIVARAPATGPVTASARYSVGPVAAAPGGWALPRGWSVPQGWPAPQAWPVPQTWSVPAIWPLPWPATPPPQGPKPVPAASTGAAAAVAYARSRLGTPYCWGGTGPGCYDCSGLTSRSWKAGGKNIPRTSEAQVEELPAVPLDKIVPGDILWRPGHVALYVGDGQVIHAPRTGEVVKYAPAAKFVKAVRP